MNVELVVTVQHVVPLDKSSNLNFVNFEYLCDSMRDNEQLNQQRA